MYISLVVILHLRVKKNYYTAPHKALQARSAARLMMAYPVIYCVCTLPLVTARLAGMAGGNPGYVYICVGGAFITSNGWLDVLLYTLTRSRYIVQGDVEDTAGVIDTFHAFGQRFDIITPQVDKKDFWETSTTPTGSSTRLSHHNRSTDSLQRRASVSLMSFNFELERARHEDAVAHLHELPSYWERTYAPPEHDRTPISPLPSLYSYSAPCLVVAPVEKE